MSGGTGNAPPEGSDPTRRSHDDVALAVDSEEPDAPNEPALSQEGSRPLANKEPTSGATESEGSVRFSKEVSFNLATESEFGRTEDGGQGETQFEENTEFSQPAKRPWYSIDWDEVGGALKVYLTWALLVGALYAAAFLLFGDDVLPDSKFFPVFIVWLVATILARVAGILQLPPLIGMLLAGMILTNVPRVLDSLDPEWSDTIRATGLAIILMRSGLELDLTVFRTLGFATLRLTVIPGVSEALAVGVASRFIFSLPWDYSILLGFIVGAVSPAVVVIGMFDLQQRGYGIDKGIPSMVVAASSFDDVVAITGYSIASGLAYATGSVVWSALKGPLNVVVGVAGGMLSGVILWYTRLWNNSFKRIAAFIAIGLAATYGLRKEDFTGAAAMWVLVMGITAAYGWKRDPVPRISIGPSSEFAAEVEHALALFWRLFQQPLLFGLIGASMDFGEVNGSSIPKAIGVIAIGLAVRLPAAYISMLGTSLNHKERLFVAMSWIAKATVQAALGSEPLEVARIEFPDDPERERFGLDILTVAVFSILLTAPAGLVIIQKLGPRWMKYTEPEEREALEPKQSAENAVMEEIQYRRSMVRKSVDALHGEAPVIDAEERRRIYRHRMSIESEAAGSVRRRSVVDAD